MTIFEGPGRVLRGPTWFTLALGGRVQEGDVIDLRTRGQVQLEFADGLLVNLAGPGTLYLASVPLRGGQPAGPVDLFVVDGWLKLAAPAPRGVRLHTVLGTIALTDAIVVLHAEAGADAVFLESGAAQLIEPKRGGAPSASRNAKGGDFWFRTDGKPFTGAPGPPPSFLEGMPRQFIDPLPSGSATVRALHVSLAADRDVLYAEAKPWLSGPYREAFLRRLRPRLEDATFRDSVEVDIHAYPEWDRILHPDKYLPKKGSEKK